MTSSEGRAAPGVAIAGMGRIGRVHARTLSAAGLTLEAVMTSRSETAKAAAAWVGETLGVTVAPCWTLDQLLDRPLEGLVVCTPHQYHLEAVLRGFDAGLSVLCEKPLVAADDPEQVAADLDRIGRHPRRDLIVNTSNVVLLEAVREHLEPLSVDEPFHFRFHTQGPYRGPAIAEDLFPHAFSLILSLFGRLAVEGLEARVTEHAVEAAFRYGGRPVRLDFRGDPSTPKALSVAMGDRAFDRVQEGGGDTYRVFMQNRTTGERFESPDPFVEFARRFAARCAGSAGGPDAFEQDAHVMRLTAQCLAAVR